MELRRIIRDGKEKMNNTYLFWIKSNRGTDVRTVFKIPNSWSNHDIKRSLEKWCSGFTAWEHSDNIVRYGYKKIKILPKKELIKKWKNICKKRDKILSDYKTYDAMLRIQKLK
jgi:hypothetical protein